MKKIPNYGEHYTLKYFLAAVENGMFIDYDGFGQYATATEMSDEYVYPSEVKAGKINRNYTHVVWFNR